MRGPIGNCPDIELAARKAAQAAFEHTVIDGHDGPATTDVLAAIAASGTVRDSVGATASTSTGAEASRRILAPEQR